MIPRIAFGGSVILLILGCTGVSEKSFSKRLAKSSCDKYKECSPGDWLSFNESMSQCTDELDGFWADYQVIHAECEYDERAVLDCLNKIDKMSCTLWDAGQTDCTAFFLCEDGQGPDDLSSIGESDTGDTE